MDVSINLTERCDNCYRGEHEERKPKRCEWCGGTGKVPTMLGREILKLVRDHLHVKVLNHATLQKREEPLELNNDRNEFWD